MVLDLLLRLLTAAALVALRVLALRLWRCWRAGAAPGGLESWTVVIDPSGVREAT